ncbi:hypothetical protein ACQEU5_03735 [Marinactinospora thermotolerans]|uniref:Uncharacterized protein n=1 Tax=Marinactinospora thermotolerans DSM 45154 TaxID=1122192 RepID=A0A1T4TCR0_9ACTN|nr:hypothetical protein [Marinactinospora thermotolerans]SKA37938.1 hypothetical protein SAMN02745673_04761 [Marinactinospora thermotolerans DSM 45154]
MTENPLSPPSPHLCICAFYGDREGDQHHLKMVHRFLESSGAIPTGDVVSAPRNVEFVMTSDIEERWQARISSEQASPDLLHGGSPDSRPVKVGFTLEPFGLVVATFDPASRGPHPICLLTDPSALGLPEGVRDEEEDEVRVVLDAQTL